MMAILVAGATGSVGRGVVKELVRRGERVRALTRDAGRASFGDGVEVVEGDLTRPATLRGAFDGVRGLHMITFGGDDMAPLETGADVLAMAAAAGVRRVSLLMGTQGDAVDRAVQASGLEWTFVQPVEFMSNARGDWADAVRAGEPIREPFVDRLSAMVHEDDIGAVAAAALTEDGHGGRTYTVTGPEVLTVRDKVAILSEAIGRPIELVELTETEARFNWAAQGYPEHVIEFFVDIYGNTPPIGRTPTSTVADVLGRPARTFADWAREHAADFTA